MQPVRPRGPGTAHSERRIPIIPAGPPYNPFARPATMGHSAPRRSRPGRNITMPQSDPPDDPHTIASTTLDQPAPAAAERQGTRIGRYKLLQPIGEGGFGSVFLAEQEHPVRRTVALKLIKPGMDTKQVVARFEAERQALAMMDHPNIARVLDGGTDAGRPYFVMELVRGLPITDYCDRRNLNTRQRLELF